MFAVRSIDVKRIQQDADVRMFRTAAPQLPHCLQLSIIDGISTHDLESIVSLVDGGLSPPYCCEAARSELMDDLVSLVSASQPVADVYRVVPTDNIFLGILDTIFFDRIWGPVRCCGKPRRRHVEEKIFLGQKLFE